MKPFLTLIAMLSWLPAASLAADPSAVVPGHPGLTYHALLRRIIPDLVSHDTNELSGHITPPARHIEGDVAKTALPERFSLHAAGIMAIPGDRARIVLFADLGPSRDSVAGVAVLGLFALTPELALLDAVEVGADRSIAPREKTPLMLAPGAPLLVIDSTHHNSSQGYQSTALIFLHAQRFLLIGAVPAFGEAHCRMRRVQQSTFTTAPDHGPYRAVLATVRESLTLIGQNCDETKSARPRITVHRALYRWDARRERFVTPSRALERLAARNATRY